MQCFCSQLRSFHAQVTENEKVSTVKVLVSERLNIPPSQQRLLYKGKALAGKSFFFKFLFFLSDVD
uniref:Ubiquitin-like domain-containing protein n=1 Tax=Sinocyclocheilus rhinocerous TaxID=307959 RepID=A0A673GEG7_9TELE